jgi:DNA polymerase III psi subunit
MNIIKTELVDAHFDVLWEDITTLTGNAMPKPVLVIVNTYGTADGEEAQVKKMLDACKLLPEQYNILQMEYGQMVAWHQLRDRLQPEIIFLIGVLPAQLGISALFSMNYPNSFDGKTWLATVSIAELEKNAEVKKQLWQNGMQPTFIGRPLPSTTPA